ncbi:MAG TPA: PIN domain-containing protein [Candidatus Diapherotrites archaeon]|uniref:PIN domain-containing protein n=1 Tax=Candidatus Iainarchaeum sp. TaxID=3101447 RepID=A0A7J4JHX6_9ARCH|nr:PIN domain-containing protein [Candidatus Diapherotrites archaeon]
MVYAFDDTQGEKHAKAKAFLREKMAEGSACLSAQNLAEFHFVMTQKVRRPVAVEKSREWVSSLAVSFDVHSYSFRTVLQAVEYQALTHAPFWDALLAAIMEENHVDTVYSEDADFKKIPWLKVINPLA